LHRFEVLAFAHGEWPGVAGDPSPPPFEGDDDTADFFFRRGDLNLPAASPTFEASSPSSSFFFPLFLAPDFDEDDEEAFDADFFANRAVAAAPGPNGPFNAEEVGAGITKK
jgi:hypothetical protein